MDGKYRKRTIRLRKGETVKVGPHAYLTASCAVDLEVVCDTGIMVAKTKDGPTMTGQSSGSNGTPATTE